MTRRITLLCTLFALLSGCATQRGAPPADIIISILGTNDVHGELLPYADRGGLVGMSGFVEALRQKRAADSGAVLLIDAGDMWQGTLESNLAEGAAMVDAYNAMRYTAATIGNHEFDFGPAGPAAIPEQPGDDPRGALKLRFAEAGFPVLAANIIDDATGMPVAWDNVRPSTMVDIQGIKVGIVGVLSANGLITTIAANTVGLSLAPLAETIRKEATALRDAGADIVIVTAHAGSRCSEFSDPSDLSSCNLGGEIMRVANALPKGLVDHIIAGHVHQGIAHIVNDIAVTSSYSSTRAFSRVDFTVDRETRSVKNRQVFPPQPACLRVTYPGGACATPTDPPSKVRDAVYEGVPVVPDAVVVAIANQAAALAEKMRNEPLGAELLAAFDAPSATESPLGNLMTDALRESLGADVAVHNVRGGIRSGLPAGPLTFGDVYKMFPFDNRVVILDLSGRDLRDVVAGQIVNGRRLAGFSGLRIFVTCDNSAVDVRLQLEDGRELQDTDRVSLLANDFLTLGGDGVLTPVIPADGFPIDERMPLVRNVLVDWFRQQSSPLHLDDFRSDDNPRWSLPDSFPESCRF
ncbi:MAG: bifunctional metallophosphatase/5'-nucleotidase [Gammaproteobacteria bacterium]|nr:bifunctional metallophosphatase/5'-nucleotidase [Gammaproteobacteria bacterium]